MLPQSWLAAGPVLARARRMLAVGQMFCSEHCPKKKNHTFGKLGGQGMRNFIARKPQGLLVGRAADTCPCEQTMALPLPFFLEEIPALWSKRDPRTVQPDLPRNAGRGTSLSEFLAKRQNISKKSKEKNLKKKRNVALILQMEVPCFTARCIFQLFVLMVPPNSLQLISNIPAQHWQPCSCRDCSSTLH